MAARTQIEANSRRRRRMVYYSFDDIFDSRDEDYGD